MQTDLQSHGVMLQRLSRHGPVVAAMHEALDRAGAGGSRNISGTSHYHLLLERELADPHGKEAALLFTSGYVSNWTTLGSLGAQLPGAVIFSKEKSHASMIEGIRHSLRAGPGLRLARPERTER
ncbi:7-keto-8-aminopelargonate synthetase-like enzyme [Ensifer mexicanus]|nr:7-keto-8-aminopelargonate synthetase-like enzyme [Sinorhizobium mexicanum]